MARYAPVARLEPLFAIVLPFLSRTRPSSCSLYHFEPETSSRSSRAYSASLIHKGEPFSLPLSLPPVALISPFQVEGVASGAVSTRQWLCCSCLTRDGLTRRHSWRLLPNELHTCDKKQVPPNMCDTGPDWCRMSYILRLEGAKIGIFCEFVEILCGKSWDYPSHIT